MGAGHVDVGRVSAHPLSPPLISARVAVQSCGDGPAGIPRDLCVGADRESVDAAVSKQLGKVVEGLGRIGPAFRLPQVGRPEHGTPVAVVDDSVIGELQSSPFVAGFNREVNGSSIQDRERSDRR